MRPMIKAWRSLSFVRSPWVVTVSMVVLLLVLLAVEGLTGVLGVEGVMVALPALAAIFLRPRLVLLVGVVAVLCVVVAQTWQQGLWSGDAVADQLGAVVISAVAVAASSVRERHERNLAQARWVAASAQQVLVRPLPSRLGPLAIASMYLAADEEASIGGDLYAAALVGGVPRIMVGDAQGKGLGATELASYLGNAFRRAARHRIPLNALPAFLDRRLCEELSDTTETETGVTDHTPAAQHLLEWFATAIVVDVCDGRLHIANCGHPSPLLITRDTVRELAATVPAPPVGLGNLAPAPLHVDRFDFAHGDTLLLYTDGVIEARDRSGTFYPLVDRLKEWAASSPRPDLLTAIHADLSRHVGGRLADDVVLVTIRHDGCALYGVG